MQFTFQNYDKEFVNFYNYCNQNDRLKKCLELEGISRDNFDVGLFTKKYFNNKTGDVSVDANANMQSNKNPNNFQSEVAKPFLKLQGYYLLWEKLKEEHGVEHANELLRKIITGKYYFHDSTSMLNHYCAAISSSHLMIEGRQYGELKSKPPRRSDSFVAQVIEAVMDLSQQQAGAIAVSDFFVNLAYYTKKENLTDYELKNSFQKLVHILNNSYRVGNQSPFTNLSIFDIHGIQNLFKDASYPDGTKPTDNVEEIVRVQKLFAEFMSEGDPTNDGLPYRFPVVTLNITIDENKNILDQNFLNWVSKINYKKGNFNIYVAESGKVASCCFKGNTEIYWDIVNPNDMYKSTFEKIYKNLKKKKEVLGNLFTRGKDYNPRECGLVRIKNPGLLITIETEKGRKITVTEDHIHPVFDSIENKEIDKKTNELKTADALKIIGEDYDKIKSIFVESDSKEEYVYCFEMKDQNDPYFLLPNGVITHNCRLTNDVNELAELKGIDSFGNGGITIGSSRVCTINMHRLAIKAIRKSGRIKRRFLEVFYMILDEAMEEVKEILLAHRKILKEKINEGFLMFFKPLHWLDLDKHLFATIGINGIAEAIKELQYDVINNSEHREYVCELLEYMDEKRKQFTKETGIMFNIEQVPAETAVIKLADKDFVFGYNKQVIKEGEEEKEIKKYNMYANQFIPLTDDVRVFDRIKVDGELVEKLSGGGISHINLQDELKTSDQMQAMITYAIDCGLTHFAINYSFGECKNGHITICGNNVSKCPICNEEIIAYYTRIVGYLTKVDNWTKVRREYEFPLRKFKDW